MEAPGFPPHPALSLPFLSRQVSACPYQPLGLRATSRGACTESSSSAGPARVSREQKGWVE